MFVKFPGKSHYVPDLWFIRLEQHLLRFVGHVLGQQEVQADMAHCPGKLGVARLVKALIKVFNALRPALSMLHEYLSYGFQVLWKQTVRCVHEEQIQAHL